MPTMNSVFKHALVSRDEATVPNGILRRLYVRVGNGEGGPYRDNDQYLFVHEDDYWVVFVDHGLLHMVLWVGHSDDRDTVVERAVAGLDSK